LVDAATPPTLLVHGRLDTLVWYRQSERLAARLAAAGVPHYFLSLPWATHAVEYNLNGPSGQLTAYALAWFLAAVTK
jgi:acetyl esterase/lipase